MKTQALHKLVDPIIVDKYKRKCSVCRQWWWHDQRPSHIAGCMVPEAIKELKIIDSTSPYARMDFGQDEGGSFATYR